VEGSSGGTVADRNFLKRNTIVFRKDEEERNEESVGNDRALLPRYNWSHGRIKRSQGGYAEKKLREISSRLQREDKKKMPSIYHKGKI